METQNQPLHLHVDGDHDRTSVRIALRHHIVEVDRVEESSNAFGSFVRAPDHGECEHAYISTTSSTECWYRIYLCRGRSEREF